MAESKSILSWLQEIPNETVRKQAIENYNNADVEWVSRFHDRKVDNVYSAIVNAFDWSKTPQGDMYWNNYVNGISEPETEPNSLQQERDEAVELVKSITTLCDHPEYSQDSNEFKIWQMCNSFLSKIK